METTNGNNHEAEVLQATLEVIGRMLIQCANISDYAYRTELMKREDTYIYAGSRLETTIARLSEDKAILFTVGNDPVDFTEFSGGAGGFIDEEHVILGAPDYVGPRQSTVLSQTRWISDIHTRTRRAYYGNGTLHLGIVELARALAAGATLTAVNASTAHAVDTKS